jgi:hypothetical protein
MIPTWNIDKYKNWDSAYYAGIFKWYLFKLAESIQSVITPQSLLLQLLLNQCFLVKKDPLLGTVGNWNYTTRIALLFRC